MEKGGLRAISVADIPQLARPRTWSRWTRRNRNAMDPLAWTPVGAVETETITQARRQAHNAAQWLARVAHSYMPAAPDHRHTLLGWDAERQALVTQEFLPRLALELRLPGLAMQFREDDRPVPHTFELDGRTPAEAEAWMLVELLHRRLDRDRFSKALPYDLPDLMTGDAVPYVAVPLERALDALAGWFSNAATVLRRIAAEDRSSHPDVGERAAVWCRPEVLDIAVLLPAGRAEPTSRRMLRAGLSAGDARETAPYFYVMPHDPGARARSISMLRAEALAGSGRPAHAALDFLRTEIEKHRAARQAQRD